MTNLRCLIVALLLALSGLAQAQTLYYIHADQLNTPRLIADEAGNTVWRWDNREPFGTNAPSEYAGANGQPVRFNLRFPGQYYDAETGTFYNYFRDYDPQTGRYVQSDPIGLAGGINTYLYVSGNPLRYSDPLGLDPWDWDGPGNTGVCAYYDEMYEKTKCDYYQTAGQICRGNRKDVNTLVRIGIAQAWASGRTTASESEILTNVRNSLASYDRAARSLGPTEACGCPKGDSIDIYHDLAFGNAGISPAFYGGNLWPQGVWPNPVPYDPTGNSSLDPRRLFK